MLEIETGKPKLQSKIKVCQSDVKIVDCAHSQAIQCERAPDHPFMYNAKIESDSPIHPV